jgi:hypothetical protein
MSELKRKAINQRIDTLKKHKSRKRTFCPADVAHALGLVTKEVTAVLREREDVILKQKSSEGSYHRTGSIWAFLLVFALLIVPVSAYSITNVQIQPTSNIVIGDQVTAFLTLSTTPSGKYTANPEGSFQIITALDNPVWTKTPVLKGARSEDQRTQGTSLILQGTDLAYPFGTGFYVNISLTGTAPNVSTTGKIPILAITEFDSNGNAIVNTRTVMERVIVSNRDLDSNIYLADRDIKKLSDDIAVAKRQGYDATAAQQFYTDAKNGLDIVRSLPPSKYPEAIIRLNEITQAISGGERALDTIRAQSEIDKAMKPVGQLDQTVGWFTGNKSTATYPGLDKIQQSRDAAVAGIGMATDSLNAGDYDISQSQARDAYEKGNSTIPLAIALQKRAMDPLTPLWDNLWVVVIGIAAIIGYLLFRKPKKGKKKEKKEVKP